jgi:Tol biopolymer transport system component
VSEVKQVAFPPGKSDRRISIFSFADRMSRNATSGYSDQEPVWSRDGSTIAFTRMLRDKPGMEVRVMKESGNGAFGSSRSLGITSNAISGLAWRPAHSEVACVVTKLEFGEKADRTRYFDIVTADTSGKVQKLTRSGDVYYKSLAWSPDGRYIAYARETPYVTNKPGNGGKFTKLVVMDVDTRGYREVVTASQLGGGSVRVSSIGWSPDGSRIVFDVLTLDKAAKTDIASITLSDNRFRWLTRDGNSRLPRWSSDGHTVLYVHAADDIRRMNPDGTNDG